MANGGSLQAGVIGSGISGTGAEGTAGNGAHSPINVGSVGDYSGVAGNTQAPPVQILQAWAAWVNSNGGINGHPIHLIVEDDRSDPSAYRADLQDLVQTQHVVALLASFASLTSQAAGNYLDQVHVPMICGDNANPIWWSDPMHFPCGPDTAGSGITFLTAVKQITSARKIATIYCQEAAGCGTQAAWLDDNAKNYGFNVVSVQQGSVAAPDYTQQCLSAQQAGAQILNIVFDVNSEKRVASSCSRVGFHPTYIVSASDATFQGISDFEGAVTASHAFPFTYGGPETQGYLQAASKYAPGTPLNEWSSEAWAAGLLFQQLVQRISGPITSQAILQQLWTLHNFTLGGLLIPITYIQNQPAPAVHCAFPMTIHGGKWVATQGLTPTCLQ